MDEYIGIVKIFAGNFAPRGWALCQGQLLSIAQNTALFSILGTTYGGDGKVTFALPDLRGRIPLGPGQGPGLQPYDLGQEAGEEALTLIITEIPMHTHTPMATNQPGSKGTPTGMIWAAEPTGGTALYTSTNPTDMMNIMALGVSGSGMPHNNLMPYLVINYIICMEGIFPARN